MANSEDTQLARQYLLGGLSAEDRDKLEQRFLFDVEFEQAVLAEETDLLDELVAGTLTPEEERAVRQWARTQDRARLRLELAGAFHQVTHANTWPPSASDDARRTRPSWLSSVRSPRFSSLSAAGLALACCILVFATLWLVHSNRNLQARLQTLQSARLLQPSMNPTAASTTPPAPQGTHPGSPAANPAPSRLTDAESVLTVLLVAQEGRGSSEIPDVVVKAGTKMVELQLIAQSELPDGRYIASVTGPDGDHLHESTPLQSHRVHQHNLVSLRLPSRSFKTGSYRVQLMHQAAPNQMPPFEYTFRIKRA